MWQPIGSAPENGLSVLVWVPFKILPDPKSGYICQGRYSCPQLDPDGMYFDCAWRKTGGEKIEPTHWMPLPDPPKATQP